MKNLLSSDIFKNNKSYFCIYIDLNNFAYFCYIVNIEVIRSIEKQIMKERLVIKNFGPIKDADISLKRFLVFIGPQSSGKSTVAKLLAIFRDIDFALDEKKNYKNFFNDYNIGSYFEEGSFLEYVCDNYTIVFKNSEWNIKIEDVFREKIKSEQVRIYNLYKEVVESNDILKEETKEGTEEFVRQVYNTYWKSNVDMINEQVYIPSERIMVSIINEAPFTVGQLAIPKCLKEFLKRFELARMQIKEMTLEFLPVVYKYENNQNRIYHDLSHSVLLSEGSSGVQAVIPIQLVIKFLLKSEKPNYSFIVEEPELNVFPKTQMDVVRFLVASSNFEKRSNELVITTHSPYVLSVLNISLLGHQVWEKKENRRSETENIIKKEFQINPSDFNAYYMHDGIMKQIFDEATGLISQNELDDVSEDMQGELDELMEIYKA